MAEYAGKRPQTTADLHPTTTGAASIGKQTLVEQAQSVIQARMAGPAAEGDAHEHAPAPPSSGGQPLPDGVRAEMEKAFGADFSAVRIHEGGEAGAVGAHAYARGNDLFFAPGQYDPTSVPGKELLGHELAHVVQQRQGRVQATAQAKGLALNADASLEHEADAAGAKAARGEAVGGGGSGSGGASPVIQRKGDSPLRPQVPADGADASVPKDPRVTKLIGDLSAYDSLADGRPSAQLAKLDTLIGEAEAIIASQPKPGAFARVFAKPKPGVVDAIKVILAKEHAVVAQQNARLTKYTASPDAPYDQMTDEGMMWKHDDFAHNTKRVGATGKDYFSDMSAQNMESMSVEKRAKVGDAPAPASEEWFGRFVANAMTALDAAVVNHYTTSTRADSMAGGGQMKSKMMLEKDNPAFKHNTSAYDDHGLGNSGFLFFFIETADAPMRGTRFAEGDDGAVPARISIPIAQSGLLTNGWIMLSDFAQREYPDLATNAAGDSHASWLPTRAKEGQEKHPTMTQPVRNFTQGSGPIEMEDVMKFHETLPTSEQRQAATAITPQVRGDADSKQTYSGPGGAKHEVPDRMLNNILVGADILPGLAMRAALEVSRIARVNPALADTLKTLSGPALMSFMLKDLFRPQAMIPNSVAIKPEHVQR